MELTPPSTPFENSYEKDSEKDKEENSNKTKKTLRVPLHASEVHGGDKRNARPEVPLFAVNKPVFEESKKTEAPKNEATTGTNADIISGSPQAAEIEQPLTHPDLERVSGDLWEEFDTTPSAAIEPSHEERTVFQQGEAYHGMPIAETHLGDAPELATPKPGFQEFVEHTDTGESFKKRTAETADDWQPHSPIHLNEPAEMPAPFPEIAQPQHHTAEATPAGPSAAGMAAEVAADEPDPNSLHMWEELNKAPAAETVPAWHPEAPMPKEQPVSTEDAFQNIMQRADMSPDFVAQASHAPALEDLPPISSSYEPPREYKDGSMYQQPETPKQNWYPAAANVSGMGASGTLAGRAAEATIGGAMAGSGTHAAEGLVAGVAAGAVAGGIAGHAAARHESRQFQQELHRRDEQYNTLANEQQQTARTVGEFAQANQQLRQQAEQAPPPPVAPKVPQEAEQLAINQNERVEQSAFVNMVVDKRTGKLVQREGVNEFGAELQHEQQFEAAPPVPADLTAQQNQQQMAQQQFQNGMPQQYGMYQNGYYPIAGGVNPTLPSGQVDPSHELTEGRNAVNPQHLLSPPRNPVMAAITSPLLWLGVAVILLAYFAAAFL